MSEKEQWEDSRQSGARVVGKMHSPATYQDAEIHSNIPEIVDVDLAGLGGMPDVIEKFRELLSNETDEKLKLDKDEEDDLKMAETLIRGVARHYLQVRMGTKGWRSEQGERMVGAIASRPPSLDEMGDNGKKGRSLRHPFGGR